MILRDEAASLIRALAEERARPVAQRRTLAPDDDLELVVAELQAWLADGRLQHLEGLGRLVTDRWSLTSPVSEAVVSLERQACARSA